MTHPRLPEGLEPMARMLMRKMAPTGGRRRCFAAHRLRSLCRRLCHAGSHAPAHRFDRQIQKRAFGAVHRPQPSGSFPADTTCVDLTRGVDWLQLAFEKLAQYLYWGLMRGRVLADVFVSYKSDDRDRLQPFFAALRAAGLSLWIDQEISHGTGWPLEIKMQLEAAGCVIGCWTKRAITSSNVFVPSDKTPDGRSWMEIEHFQAGNKLVGVLFDPGRIPYQFQNSQAADLSRWGGDQADAEFSKLVRSIESKATPLFARRAIRTLEGRVETAEQETHILQQQIVEKSDRIAELHQKIAAMHGGGIEARALAARLSESEQSLTKLGTELTESKEQARKLERRLREREEDQATLAAEFKRLTAEHGQSEMIADSLKAEIAKNSQAMVDQAAREKELLGRISEGAMAIERLEAKIAELEEARASMVSEVELLRAAENAYRDQASAASNLAVTLKQANLELENRKKKISDLERVVSGEPTRISAARVEERGIQQRVAHIDNRRAIEAGLADARKGAWRWALGWVFAGGLAGALIGNGPSLDQGRKAAQHDAILAAARATCAEVPSQAHSILSQGPNISAVGDQNVRSIVARARQIGLEGETNACVNERFDQVTAEFDRPKSPTTEEAPPVQSADAEQSSVTPTSGKADESTAEDRAPRMSPRSPLEAGQDWIARVQERSEVWAYNAQAGRYAGSLFVRSDGKGYPNGLGVMIYTDGNRYEGEWKDGSPSGTGVLWASDGTIIN